MINLMGTNLVLFKVKNSFLPFFQVYWLDYLKNLLILLTTTKIAASIVISEIAIKNINKARSVIVINFFSCKKSHFRKLKKKKKP